MTDLKSYGLISHQGPHLNLNEDLIEVDLVNNLFFVADGFGGSNIGDNIVKLALETVKRSFTKISSDQDATLPFYYSHRYLLEGNALINAIAAAHQAINKENGSKPLSKKGGASVLIGAKAENVMSFISSGNCILYLYRKGSLRPLFLPDTIGNLSRDQFHAFHQTIPLSGLGLFEDIQYQITEVKLSLGDVLIFLTDGIYGRISDSEIKYSIEKNLENENEILKSLIKLANERGNLDNQSGLILQF